MSAASRACHLANLPKLAYGWNIEERLERRGKDRHSSSRRASQFQSAMMLIHAAETNWFLGSLICILYVYIYMYLYIYICIYIYIFTLFYLYIYSFIYIVIFFLFIYARGVSYVHISSKQFQFTYCLGILNMRFRCWKDVTSSET